MCLQNFQKFRQIGKDNAIVGYRSWRVSIKEPTFLISEVINYEWNKLIEGPHEVLSKDSGIYAYNYNNCNYYNCNHYNYYNNYYNCNYYNCNHYNYYNNYYNYYNYNYNYNYNYYKILGIIKQYGKVAIHEFGQRSQYAIIDSLFTIRESDSKGPQEFLDWIKKFNLIIIELSKKYKCNTISWQDFIESK